ncbi:MAG: bifunctional precorrin-2 dehydrogenase/sirohydrochlorin ferrochelatase [Ilumatobacteraceae bacterium]
MAFGYPVMLDLTGADVLVVGGGAVAARKVPGLVGAGAIVTVVAPTVRDGIGAQRVERRPFEPGDVAGRTLVFTCTDVPAVNAAVAVACRAAGVWVNSADDPANCTFALPAVARAGRVVVAVGSGGASPALAQHVRDRVAAEILDERIAAAAEVLAAERDAIHAAGGSTEGVDWRARLVALLRGDP